MCMALYIAADQPIPEALWVESDPHLGVMRVAAESPVHERFSNTHVYDVVSHEGCACGFQLGQFPEFEDEEAPLKRRSLTELAAYLEERLAEGRKIELFACWSGDESEEPESTRTLAPQDLRADTFYFREKEAILLAQHT